MLAKIDHRWINLSFLCFVSLIDEISEEVEEKYFYILQLATSDKFWQMIKHFLFQETFINLILCFFLHIFFFKIANPKVRGTKINPIFFLTCTAHKIKKRINTPSILQFNHWTKIWWESFVIDFCLF